MENKKRLLLIAEKIQPLKNEIELLDLKVYSNFYLPGKAEEDFENAFRDLRNSFYKIEQILKTQTQC